MNILFEELGPAQRAGGIEAACSGLVRRLEGLGNELVRRDSAKSLVPHWQPDLVHVHGIWSPSLMRRWKEWRGGGVPCVATIHGMLEPWALGHKKWKKRLAWLAYQKECLQSADLLHATSEREVGNLRRLGLRPPVAMIPWAIEAVEPRGGERPCARSSGAHRTALFVGRLYPVKGLPLLLEAWARGRPSGWRLRLVGPDEAGHRAELERLADTLGLREVVEFTGALAGSTLSDAYHDADLFLLPSHTENFGMVVGEALAHGLPVIATHAAPWKLLEDEKCGWWVPVNVEGIASALDDATCRSPEELAAMGARGREVVAERFSWDKIARDFSACYEWLLGRGSKQECVR